MYDVTYGTFIRQITTLRPDFYLKLEGYVDFNSNFIVLSGECDVAKIKSKLKVYDLEALCNNGMTIQCVIE